MKTARITFLGTDDFKARLETEAKVHHISVAELIRQQFEREPSVDEQLLLVLAKELKHAVADTRRSLKEAVDEVDKTLKVLTEQRKVA